MPFSFRKAFSLSLIHISICFSASARYLRCGVTKEKYASNPDVDTARSHLNFHLVTPQRKYRAEAEKQIAEAGCRTRSDSVRVVEALVTASPEFFKGKKKMCIRDRLWTWDWN